MQEVPSAADVVLAGLLAAEPVPGRVVAATPLAGYARCGNVLVGLLAPAAVRVPGSVVAPPGLVSALTPGDEVLAGGGGLLVPGARLTVRRWWDSAVPRIPSVSLPAAFPGVPAVPGVPDDVAAGARVLWQALGGECEPGEAVRGLVGLGPGLTPAGDDVVAAVLVALVAAGAHARAGAVLAAVRPCLHRTTHLSAALLAHAAAGRAVPELARYLHAPDDPDALAHLLAVGGTSGAALALGARIGLSAAAATMASPVDREVA